MPASFDVVAFEAHNERELKVGFLGGCHHAFGDGVAVHDATENVDENGLDRWIAQDNFKCGLHLLLRGSTADIEKVGRSPP